MVSSCLGACDAGGLLAGEERVEKGGGAAGGGMVTFSSEDLCLHGLFPVYFTARWVTSVRPVTLQENKCFFLCVSTFGDQRGSSQGSSR